MTNITNNANLELAPAVWLLFDDYDYNSDPYTISTTTLLQPLKSVILAAQHQGESNRSIDLVDIIAARMGTAFHDSLEAAWGNKKHVVEALSSLGLPNIADRIRINPSKKERAKKGVIPVYIENRTHKKVGVWTVSGKYDIVMDGQVQDYKSTSVWAWIFGSHDHDYIMQGSIYRWLNPEIIKEDTMMIHFVFTDWSKVKASQDPKYPQTRITSKQYKLMSVQETDKWIKDRLTQIDHYLHETNQHLIPSCDSTELWQRETTWKYYKSGDTSKRATKNFNSKKEADAMQADNGCGCVIMVPGEVVRCKYCNSMDICEQAAEYKRTGLIKFN